MSKFIIKGGTPLYGSVRLGGAKNASYKLMIASLLSSGESRLLNFSHIEDVKATGKIIETLGGNTQTAGERTIFINPSKLNSSQIPDRFGPRSRASSMFIPALLHLFGKAIVPAPGGDKIGSRPLDRHFEALTKMGANIKIKGRHIIAQTDGLRGITHRFNKNSHTGTETLIIAAVKALGTTVIENAALEPEVDDLIDFLTQMGANIRRRPGRVIEIKGVRNLKPTIFKIMPDRNEAVSYAVAAIATKGDIIVENANPDHLEAFLEKLDHINAGYEIGNYGIRFYYQKRLKATDVVTAPHPGFMTDWQPLWTVLMTQAHGESLIHETVFPSRFQHVEALKALGADIKPFHLNLDNPDKTYNFNLDGEPPNTPHAIKIHGPTTMSGGEATVFDLRSGATMVLAALVSSQQTTLNKIELIDRGYESFDKRLCSMGANIKRQKS